MSNLTFAINGHSLNATQFKAKARDFTILVDEPQGLGGLDAAPNPVEYLLASYAGCLNVVAHLVAAELNITIRSLNIDIGGEINPARLFGQSEQDRAGFKGLEVNLRIDSNATPQQLEVLLAQTKKRCPVNDNLSQVTPVQYKLTPLAVAVS
jgi:uncharacterized OsmC-like protein